ncbi:MAG: M28 family peptidase [Proteobacteria bacterium]|nr:M28 family peptidase [Pseudomonadota bacterium]
MRGLALLCLAAIGACVSDRTQPPDSQTAAWWRTTAALSNDGMEGRDIGSAGYERAAAYVADRFARAQLRPAGDDGTYFQRIHFQEVEVTSAGTTIVVRRPDGAMRALGFLQDVTVSPTWNMTEALDAPLVFRGYCAPSDMTGVRGAVVVCFGARRAGQTTATGRLDAATAAGAAAIVNIDDPGFTIEPARWPVAYARTVVFADGERPHSIPVMRLSAQAFTDIAGASGQNAGAILARGASGAPLASFDFGARLEAHFATRMRSYASENVVAVLPGTDPALANQPVLLSAHLDGYGYGTPVNGDNLYNGALDDAAYVATLITFADERRGRGFRRPMLFAAMTGEEKGLLGSRWMAAHPTAAAPTPVAVLNLDQLRPLYPFTILTTLGLEDSSLGQTVRTIAEPMGIEVRADLEPERNLLRRTDHWPFMQRGVPAVSFLFGFNPGTEAEARYRDWYLHRYHAPQDDIRTPIDFGAQAKFHRFYFALAEAVANAEASPQWLPNSPNRPAAMH